jgi:hypothetical protein
MKITHKGWHVNTLENYHIYKATKQHIQLNDTLTQYTNTIFNTLTKLPSYVMLQMNLRTLISISTHKHTAPHLSLAKWNIQ